MGSITNLKQNKTLFIPCNCESEILAIIYDHETKTADVCIYETMNSFKHKLSFWQKIRYCYRVFVHNKPYSDQIILKRDQLIDMKKFLDSLD